MVNLPLALYSAEQVKQLDKLAMVKAHLSPSELMQRAALAAWKVFLQHWPKAKNVAVICGGGNNGGDGYEFACLAKQQGLTVNLYDIAPNDFTKRTSESQGARQKWLESGGQIQAILEKFDEDVIVDALLGIGTRFPLEKSFTNAILAINQSQKPVLSMDIPSGLQCDLGILPSVCVNATVTITFVGIKIGLLSHQGNEVIGELFYDNLGISNEILNTISPIAHRIDYDTLKAKLPVRRLTANKSSQGHVLIIGAGKAQFGGAVCLAGEAALRAGAGLVSVAVSPESVVRTSRATSELMMTGCQSFEEMKALFERATVLLLGPGLSQNAWAEKVFHGAISQSIPMVIDADGLNWLAQFPQKMERAILTPHPGEAARLLNTTVSAIQSNRLESVKALQAKFGGVVILKGAGTFVTDGAQIAMMAGAYPALATAGTGDVLAGVVSALLAQGLAPFDAATLGVCVHALAAVDQSKKGMRGMIASDLLSSIRERLNVKGQRS